MPTSTSVHMWGKYWYHFVILNLPFNLSVIFHSTYITLYHSNNSVNSNVNFVFFTAKTAPLSVPALQATMREPALLSPRLTKQDSTSVCVRACVRTWTFFVFVCVCGCLLSIEQMLMCEWVQLFVFAELVQYGSVGVWICCLDECLRDNWEREDGDQIQSMDLEIPQDHPVMLLN